MASRSLGVLTLDLVARTGMFERGMDKAARTADKRMNDIAAKAKKIGTVIGTALVAAAGAAAIAIKGTIDAMDDMSKAAQRANLSTEEFSRLAYAGSLADVSIEELSKSMGKLAKAQGDAAQGLTTQIRGFESLGIAYKNADGSLRSTIEVFKDFADVFQRNQGSPEVMALGMQVFGRSFQNLIPLMKDGRAGLQGMFDEADRLGKTLDGETGRAAEHFNDNLTRLNARFTGLKQEIAGQMLPTLIKLSEEFLGAANDGNSLESTARSIGQAFNAAVSGILNFHDRLVVLRSTMAQFELQARQFSPMDGIRSLVDGGRYMAPYEAMVKRQQDLAKQAENARARIAGRNGPFAGVSGSARGSWENMPASEGLSITAPTKAGKSGGKSQAEKEAEALARAYQSMNERLDEQHALFGKVGEAARVRYEIEHGSLKGITQAEADLLIQKAERNDLQREEHELFEKSMKLAEEEARAAKALAERQASMVDDMRFELSLYGMTNRERERAIALRYAEAAATSELGRAILDLSDQLYEARKAQEVWDEFQRSMSDAFADLASGAKSLKDVLTDFFDSIAAAITRSIAESWAETITGWFKGASSGGGGGGGSWWQGLLQSFFGGGKASGGSVKGGMLYEVNEQGTEMFSAGGRDYLLAGTDGHITPAHKLVGGSIVQNNNFILPERASPSTQSQIAQRTGIATQTAARRNG